MINLLTTIHPEDVDPDFQAVSYSSYSARRAMRAVVIDNGRIALIHGTNRGYIMLPGGAVDEG